MNNIWVILLTCVTLQACTTASSVVGLNRRSMGAVFDDGSFERSIKYGIEEKLAPKSTHINVNSFNRIVLLTGEVGSERDKTQAELIARSTPNVRNVYNRIVIAPPSTTGNRLNDTFLTAKVKKALLGNKFISSDDISVISERGEVYLLGLLTPDEVRQTSYIASTVEGVLKVHSLFETLN